jgi:hypothetical protein
MYPSSRSRARKNIACRADPVARPTPQSLKMAPGGSRPRCAAINWCSGLHTSGHSWPPQTHRPTDPQGRENPAPATSTNSMICRGAHAGGDSAAGAAKRAFMRVAPVLCSNDRRKDFGKRGPSSTAVRSGRLHELWHLVGAVAAGNWNHVKGERLGTPTRARISAASAHGRRRCRSSQDGRWVHPVALRLNNHMRSLGTRRHKGVHSHHRITRVLVDNRLDLQPAVSPRPAPAQDDRHPRSPAPPSSQGRPWSGCPQHSTGAHRRAKSAGTWPVARRVQETGKSGSVPPQNAVVSGRVQETGKIGRGRIPVSGRVQERGKSGSVPPQNAVVSGRVQETGKIGRGRIPVSGRVQETRADCTRPQDAVVSGRVQEIRENRAGRMYPAQQKAMVSGRVQGNGAIKKQAGTGGGFLGWSPRCSRTRPWRG